MKTKKYITPAIDCITLDNNISLALQSAPPDGPGEDMSQMDGQTNFSNNSFTKILA
jgi:hypothetical protein